jgi:2-C-methyl-D-erythritol 2,4-cyclodiphosphate synthase
MDRSGFMYRIGQSTDIHQLDSNLPLIIGGVVIPSERGIVAHSDGDILLHAITESIIGALGLGDLGTFFDDNDPINHNRSSMEMLKIINELMIENKYRIQNIDSLIIIEQPKIKPYIEEMKVNICDILKIDLKQLNIKATRGEKIGFLGRKEGVVAQAITLLEYGI